MMDAAECQLVFIRSNQTLGKINPNIDLARQNAQILAHVATLFSIPVWAVGADPVDQHHLVQFSKHFNKSDAFSAFETLRDVVQPPTTQGGNARSLPKHLQKQALPEQPKRPFVVLVGWQTHVEVLQTAMDFLDEGFEPVIVVDACACGSTAQQDVALDRLASVGADLVTVEMLVHEWLRASDHPLFDQCFALLQGQQM